MFPPFYESRAVSSFIVLRNTILSRSTPCVLLRMWSVEGMRHHAERGDENLTALPCAERGNGLL